jgi:hypothetical protein
MIQIMKIYRMLIFSKWFSILMACLSLLPLKNVSSQIGTGQWRLHIPNQKAIDVVATKTSIFTAFEKGLLEYDLIFKEKTIWDNVNYLSDLTLTSLAYYEAQDAVFVGYENGNIDKIMNNRVYNIPAIPLSQIQGNKRINKIVVYKDEVFFATGFSIVKIDPIKNEVRDTYYPTAGMTPIIDVAFRNDTIFALTKSRMYKAHVNNQALADPSQWKVDTRLAILEQDTYKEIEVLDENLFVLYSIDDYGKDSVFIVKNNGLELFTNSIHSLEINSIRNTGGKLVVNTEGAVMIYNTDGTIDKNYSAFNLGFWIQPNNSILHKNILWFADNSNALLKCEDEFKSVKYYFDGPPRKSVYKLSWTKGKLAVAGGTLSPNALTFNKDGVYTMIDEQWTHISPFLQEMWKDKNVWDFSSVSINPKNINEIAIGKSCEFPLSIVEDGKNVKRVYNHENSIIEANSSCISDLKYDNDGNLWLINCFSNNPLKVLTKDGVWQKFETGNATVGKFTGRIAIDNFGNKWFTVHNTGVIAYNDGGTIEDTSDDKFKLINNGEFTGDLPSPSVTSIAVDFDNRLWIGTTSGFAILYNSTNVFDALPGEYNAQRIKLNFEGNVEYLLGNTSISDIEIDGGNRKWIATSNSGVFLLSADGQEIIEHFTKENSPLISNNIVDLEINHDNGEVFIVTDIGLVSYRTDASYGDPNYSNVTIFPNPARPDFDGPVTIQGIQYNSDVKVTDISGNLVFKTTSNGGTASWNGKNLNGERVQPGVYLFWTANNEGKGRFVGKVLIVN